MHVQTATLHERVAEGGGYRLVSDLMRLCLLLGRHYSPYSKWMGSVFAQLPESASLTPILRAALAVTDQRQREWHLARNYETVTPGIPDSGSPNLSIRAFVTTTRGLSGVTRRSICQGAAVRSADTV
jgi:hypothetical protein